MKKETPTAIIIVTYNEDDIDIISKNVSTAVVSAVALDKGINYDCFAKIIKDSVRCLNR